MEHNKAPGQPLGLGGHARRAIGLSIANAKKILERALDVGSTIQTSHFRSRCRERGFDAVDAERVIRFGNIVIGPDYSVGFDTWKFEVEGRVAEGLLRIVVALDGSCDMYDRPTIILVTGYYKE